ncbi:ovostatin-like [Pelobates fuscus]|uniref:ovostatin-like n=1 Tax=Pelobates fuscus TaxID=191477 RepID=UPI002FE4C155
MCMKQLLLSVSLLCLIDGGRSETQYMFITPALLKSQETGKVCVTLKKIDEPLDLNVVLQLNGQNTTIFSEDVPPPSFFQCNDITAPSAGDPTVGFIMFSAIGTNTTILDRKSVVVQSTENHYFFQMDKPLYKQGQKVQFRIISLDSNLKPVKESYPVVYLQDPSQNRLVQWKNQESNQGVVSMEFQLNDDAAPGNYFIRAERSSGSDVDHSFNVDEYVLPRFSTELDSPNTLSVLDGFLSFNISASYTYGQPVPGTILAKSCLQNDIYGRSNNCYKNSCLNITGKLDSEGNFHGAFELKSFDSGFSGSQRRFVLDAIVTEDGTGIQDRKSRYTWMTSELARLYFDYGRINRYYKRGLPFKVSVVLKDEKNNPMQGEKIELEINRDIIQNVTTNADGRATYEIDTSNFVEDNFTIKASYKNPNQCYFVEWRGWDTPDYPTAEYTALRFYSVSGNFLQIQSTQEELSCWKSHSITVSYVLTAAGIGKDMCGNEKLARSSKDTDEFTFYYVVLNKMKIVHSGQKKVPVTNSLNGTFSIDLSVTSEWAPSAQLIVYALPEEELVADTANLNVDTCFQNQVSLTFSEEKATPASSIDVQVTGAPMSLCGIRVIDSSLLILSPYESFNADAVYNSLRYSSLYGYNVGGFDLEEPAPPCEDANKQIFYNGGYYTQTSSNSEGDTYNTLKEIGMIVGTNARLKKPVVCGMEPNVPFHRGGQGFGGIPLRADMKVASGSGGGSGGGSGFGGGGESIVTVRKNFAETFVWKMVPLDSEGRATLSEIIPDTITEWKGSVFCTSEKQGFGMTRSYSNLTSFMPFFMEMSMPYSIVRGETLVLAAVIANYMDMCADVTALLSPSNDFTAQLQSNKNPKKKIADPDFQCICNKQRASFTYHVQAKKIGEISIVGSGVTSHIKQSCKGPSDASQPPRNDTVIQTLRVEAEGIKKEETISHLVCVQDTNSQVPLKINSPTNVVADSASAFVTVFGDLMSLPSHFLEAMIQLPTGCGEQNIALLAIIPAILNYLNVTNQLTPEKLEKAKNFMSQGYYRQLQFKDNSGCYTLFKIGLRFGDYKPSCNSWLTAKTFIALEDVKHFVYIDENVQEQALIYLSRSQKLDTGCFKPEGKLFRQQSEEEDAISYTAILAIALLKSNYSPGKTLQEGAVSCLKNAYSTASVKSTYNKALLAYVFTLAGLDEERSAVLSELKSRAISQGGTIHWERDGVPVLERAQFFPSPLASQEVETAAYVLLAHTMGRSVTQEDKNTMAEISRFLVQQQNSYGSFRSTQDTVVALQALAEFAKHIFTPNSHNTVQVNSRNRKIAQIDVNQENRLVVQRQPLPSVNGQYDIVVGGSGCCLVQSTVRYNIPVPKENSAFALSVTTSAKDCLNGVAVIFTVNVTVRYQGKRNASNMAIIDCKMLSGFKADYMSLRELKQSNIISESEEKNGHLYFYFPSISKDTKSFSFKVEMGSRVLNVKSSSAYVWDYYETAENGYASYQHPCATQN